MPHHLSDQISTRQNRKNMQRTQFHGVNPLIRGRFLQRCLCRQQRLNRGIFHNSNTVWMTTFVALNQDRQWSMKASSHLSIDSLHLPGQYRNSRFLCTIIICRAHQKPNENKNLVILIFQEGLLRRRLTNLQAKLRRHSNPAMEIVTGLKFHLQGLQSKIKVKLSKWNLSSCFLTIVILKLTAEKFISLKWTLSRC
jgi:hypothetical protein